MPHFHPPASAPLLHPSSLFAYIFPAQQVYARGPSELVGPILLEELVIISSTCAVCEGLKQDFQSC